MTWSFTIAKIAGTKVNVHITFIMLIAWLGAQFWVSEGSNEALKGVAFICAVFLCVLLHEFGHVAAALRYGITTPKVTLYPMGGLASMTRIPEKPTQEIVVAIAGPLVNLLIVVVLSLAIQQFPSWEPESMEIIGGSFFAKLIWVNLILFFFNLIPAFPMDGGRVLRAVLHFFFPRDQATSYAALVGQVIAVFGGGVALMSGQPFLFIIAVFIFFAAGSEASLAKAEHLLEGVSVHDASIGEFHTVTLEDTIQHAVDLMLESSQADFPVVNQQGQCIGIATRNDIVRTLSEFGAKAFISDAVTSIPAQIEAQASALDAWHQLSSSKLPGAAVVDKKGRLQRWFTTENISELVLTRSAEDKFLRH